MIQIHTICEICICPLGFQLPVVLRDRGPFKRQDLAGGGEQLGVGLEVYSWPCFFLSSLAS